MDELDLKISKTLKSVPNQIELTIEAPTLLADRAYTQALRNAAEHINVSGFRKGKAPREVVEKTVGVGYLSQKAFESIFYEVLINAANKEKLDVIDVVEISSYELLPGKPLVFKVLVELKPEVKIGKYTKLKVKAKKTVYDKEIFIKKTLEKIANNLVSYKIVTDRSLTAGDQATIDFEGHFEDGSEVPGGKAENLQVILEKDKFLGEFVDNLIGTKIGETKEILLTFPQDSLANFSDRKANFKVTVKGIGEKVVPEINDELAKKLNLDNLGALKKKIEVQMVELQNLVSQNELENKMVDQVIQNSKIELSNRMIDKEVDFLLRDVRAECEKKGTKWADFKADEKNKELFVKAQEAAVKRISIDLVLSTIVKRESIAASKEDIDGEVQKKIHELGENYKQLENDARFRNSVELVILRNKAVDFLLKNNEAVWEQEVNVVVSD